MKNGTQGVGIKDGGGAWNSQGKGLPIRYKLHVQKLNGRRKYGDSSGTKSSIGPEWSVGRGTW